MYSWEVVYYRVSWNLSFIFVLSPWDRNLRKYPILHVILHVRDDFKVACFDIFFISLFIFCLFLKFSFDSFSLHIQYVYVMTTSQILATFMYSILPNIMLHHNISISKPACIILGNDDKVDNNYCSLSDMFLQVFGRNGLWNHYCIQIITAI